MRFIVFSKREKKIIDNLFDMASMAKSVANARIVAGLVYKGELIAIGGNKLKTHPFQNRYSKNDESPYLHAENDCIVRGLRDFDSDLLAKSKLFVVRAKKKGPRQVQDIWGLAKPCDGCMRAIRDFKIKDVWYSTDEGDMALVMN